MSSHSKLISGCVDLHSKKNSHQISIPNISEGEIEEIYLSIHLYAIWSQARSPFLKLDEADDIRIYLHHKSGEMALTYFDITHLVLRGIKEELDLNCDVYAQQYIACLNNLKDKQLRGGYDGEYIDLARIDSFKQILENNSSDLTKFLRNKHDVENEKNELVFGNNTPYHIANFLHWGIDNPPIPLSQICRELGIDLRAISAITVSAGKEPSFDESFSEYGTGGVSFNVECVEHNPLEDRVNEILQWARSYSELIDEIGENVESLHLKRELLLEELTELRSLSMNLDKEVSSLSQRVEQVLQRIEK